MNDTPHERAHRPHRSPMRDAIRRAVTEPMVVFVVIGTLLFVVHRFVAGDANTVVVTAGLKADLTRRFQDQNGRRPTADEFEALVRNWKRDEALYREALREGLDREDATVRTVLADRVRGRVALELRKPVPTDADLERWLREHPSAYELPLVYDYESIAFPRGAASSARDREASLRALTWGADPASLGRPVIRATLPLGELRALFGPLADRVAALAVGRWTELENDRELLLVRLNRIEGGLPPLETVRSRVVADWTYATEQRLIEERLDAIVARYRFEEKP